MGLAVRVPIGSDSYHMRRSGAKSFGGDLIPSRGVVRDDLVRADWSGGGVEVRLRVRSSVV